MDATDLIKRPAGESGLGASDAESHGMAIKSSARSAWRFGTCDDQSCNAANWKHYRSISVAIPVVAGARDGRLLCSQPPGGPATSAAIAGASERSIMAQTGHRSSAMVRRYIRDSSLFRENAAAKVGL